MDIATPPPGDDRAVQNGAGTSTGRRADLLELTRFGGHRVHESGATPQIRQCVLWRSSKRSTQVSAQQDAHRERCVVLLSFESSVRPSADRVFGAQA